MDNNSHTPKRKLSETSPEKKQTIKKMNIETTDLISIIKNTINSNLDEKLKNLPTKDDIEEIRKEITSVSTLINSLQNENLELKQKLDEVTRENNEVKRQINWLKSQIKCTKLFIRGLPTNKSIYKAVQNLIQNDMGIKLKIVNVRKIYERYNMMSALVELENQEAVNEVLRNTKKLANTRITIERDMEPIKQQKKKKLLDIKRKLLAINKDHKIVVREDRMRVKDKWFMLNNNFKLVAGKYDGIDELEKIYGEQIKELTIHLSGNLMESKN